MFKDKLKKLADPNSEKDTKKKIENLVVLVIILVITIIIINNICNNNSVSNREPQNTTSAKTLAAEQVENSQLNNNEENQLEVKLENILNSITGVGKVNVFINYSESSKIEAMYNETTKESSTEETDTSGGVRTIQETDTQKDVIYSENNGEKQPVTQKVTNPVIEGAIITAEGANDANVKTNIINAVSAATGLATHKIQVFEMNKN